jgi:RAB6A-GEF complex partner protein 2
VKDVTQLQRGFPLFILVSFDVAKDGANIATLTFTKSAYRLGESILGVVELNPRTGFAKVLKVDSLYQ